MRLTQGTEIDIPDPRYPNVSWSPFAFHLIPRNGLSKAASIMRSGEVAGREPEGWRNVPVLEHVNHAIGHLLSFLECDGKDPHLAHAACRILMALDLDGSEKIVVPLPSPDPPKGRACPRDGYP